MSSDPCIYIVDDDYAVCDGLTMVIENAGFTCQAFQSAEKFLQSYCPDQLGCLLLDINMPGMSGYELQAELNRRNITLPIIFLTAYGTIPMTVRAMKAGASDFLTKPVPSKLLIERLHSVLQQATERQAEAQAKELLCRRLNELTARELEVFPLIVEGFTNKEIARQLGISYRTIEVHRARILQKTGITSYLELARLYDSCKLPPRS